eukprot:TRINITY_DN212_c0_g1_i1.p1 TRINITY_DN212_c0_g1~~TRINITY_DN212_c0_g1_i1.p1  ORF type:complete len:212 (-),score=89.10 TRINITY_DN212_c0_g1_i1:138-773(-)
MSEIVLYSYWRSSCSWRVRLVLHYKNITFTYIPIHLVKNGGEQLKDEFKMLNPMAQIPALSIDGHLIAQSLAIIDFLEERFPNNSIYPNDLFQKTKVKEIAQLICSGIQPLQNLKVLNKIGAEKMTWAKYWITEGLQALEAVVSKVAGAYCVGDSITLADFCLVPQLYNARRFQVDLSAYPTIVRIDEALVNHPVFKLAHPDVQPDAEVQQ